MIIGLIIVLIIMICQVKREKGLKNILNKYKKEWDMCLVTLILIGLACATVSLFIGIMITDIDNLYESYLYESNEISSYIDSDTVFNIGVIKYRGSSEYAYKLNTDKGRIEDTIYTHRVYIKDLQEGNARIETHRYKFKNNKMKLIAYNMKSNYKVLVMPKGYKEIIVE